MAIAESFQAQPSSHQIRLPQDSEYSNAVTKSLPEDPAELRVFTTFLVAEVKSQTVLIQKLQHQLAGHRAQLQLALEMSEIAIAAITARLRQPNDAPADKPKRKPLPDHIPRIVVELTPGSADCA